MPRSRLPPVENSPLSPPDSARRGRCGHVARRHAVLDLGVGDGAVLLPQMQPKLTLVAEVQVAFLTLKGGRKKKKKRALVAHVAIVRFDSFLLMQRVDLHGTASLPCVCAGGSSASAGGGSAFRRSRRDTASPPCGSTRGRAGEQPAVAKQNHTGVIFTHSRDAADCR